jgi:hypothetical protein
LRPNLYFSPIILSILKHQTQKLICWRELIRDDRRGGDKANRKREKMRERVAMRKRKRKVGEGNW